MHVAGSIAMLPGQISLLYRHAQRLTVDSVQNNMAELQVHVAGSSIAMLQGQRPPFRLLVRVATARHSRRLDFIKPAVSDAFVVRITAFQTPVHSYICLPGTLVLDTSACLYTGTAAD